MELLRAAADADLLRRHGLRPIPAGPALAQRIPADQQPDAPLSEAAPREGLRRALHVLTGAGIAACCTALPHRTTTILFIILLALLLMLEALRFRIPALQASLLRLSSGAVRPAERRGITGGTVLLVGYALTWWIFPSSEAVRAILVAATADPAASAVGTMLAPRGRKTLAGSAAACVAALLVLAITGTSPLAAVLGALAATLAERIPGGALDNLSVPLGTAAVLRALA